MSRTPTTPGLSRDSTGQPLTARWMLAIAGYFLFYTILRVLIGPPFFWDEAEAFYHSRELATGYGPQPPLYNWLQWGAFQVLGERLAAVVLLRAGLWCAALMVLFRLLSREAGPQVAGASVLALSLLPVLSWEAQKTYTHSLVALLIAVLVTGTVLRVLRRGSWGDHFGLGLLLGLGMLSKLNFVLWPIGLLAGAAFLREWRGGLRPIRLLVAAGMAAVVAMPYALWAWHHPELAGASLDTLDLADEGGLTAWLTGTGAVFSAAAAFWGLALLVLGGFAIRSRASEDRSEGHSFVRLLVAGTAAMLALVWLGVIASGTTDLRERWLLPMGWGLVVALVLGLWPRLTPGRRRRLLGVTGALWALGLLAVPYSALVDPGRRGTDYGLLADHLRAMGAPELPTYVIGTTTVGNLALAAPALGGELLGPKLPAGDFLLVAGERKEVTAAHPNLAGRMDSGVEVTLPRRTEPLRLRIFRVDGE